MHLCGCISHTPSPSQEGNLLNNTMKKLFTLIGGLCVASMLQAQVRTEQLFEKGWKFTREDKVEFSQAGYDDVKWQSVTVPHDWAIYGPFSINNDKQNIAITKTDRRKPWSMPDVRVVFRS